MTITKNTMLIIVLIVVVVLFLYFGSETFMDGGMNGSMHENGWMGGSGWRWFPTIGTFVFGVLSVGSYLERKHNQVRNF